MYGNVDSLVFFAQHGKILIFLQYRESGQSAWVYFITEKISADASSFVMRNLTANSTYLIKLAAKNE
jgi:hypothetical protein